MDISNIVKTLKQDKQFKTEESTKMGLILPLFMNLGYNVFDPDEFVPEADAQFNGQKGVRVDYAVYVSGQPVMLIECKQRDKALDQHVNQLGMYFNSLVEMKLGVLTNGDDYWFFTDSKHENIMDPDPYFKIRLSTATVEEIQQLEDKFSRQNITKLDIKKDLKWQQYLDLCDDFVNNIYSNKIPNWVVSNIIQKSDTGLKMSELNQYDMADALYNRIIAKFNGYKIESTPVGISENDVLIYMQRRSFGDKVDARAIYHRDDETLTLLMGSIISQKMSDDAEVVKLRSAVQSNIRDTVVVLNIDCKNLDDAAMICLGNRADGSIVWVTESGIPIKSFDAADDEEYDAELDFDVDDEQPEDIQEPKKRGRKAKIKEKSEQQKRREAGYNNRSNIKLNHEYVYNDYSDGDWRFHTIDYAVIFDTKYEEQSGRKLLLQTIKDLINKNKVTRESLMQADSLKGLLREKSEVTNGDPRFTYLDDEDIMVMTKLGISDIIKNVHKLLEVCGLPDDQIKLQFKD